MDALHALEAPVLLVAMPQVMDPFFHRSVVLLAAHEDEGSFGFIVNRPADLRVAEILARMEIEWRGDPGSSAFVGGPVQPQLGTVLFTSDEIKSGLEAASEVLPGVSITQHLESLTTLARRPPRGIRLLLGHAGWSAGQLIQEVLRNDWVIAPPGHELIFAPDPGSVWEEAMRSVGFDPDALPSWTAPGGEEEAN
jgi:putative transcriptional regulator